MVISKTEKTVICLHKEDIVGTIGTCKLCGQKRQYDFSSVKDPPKLIKRGRINGLLTDVIPTLASGPVETIAPEPEPEPQPEPEPEPVPEPEEEKESDAPPVEDIVARGIYWDKHQKEMLADLLVMSVKNFVKKWHFKDKSEWYLLRLRWKGERVEIPDLRQRDNAKFITVAQPEPEPVPQPEPEPEPQPEPVPAAVDKKEVEPTLTKMGRPRTGLATNCVDCGTELYVAKNRIREGKEYRCRKCMSRKAAKAPRPRIRVPTAVDKRRKNYKDEGWEPAIRLALRRLAVTNTEDPYDKTMNMLAKYLKMEPVETTELLVGIGIPFTIEKLMQEAFALFVNELLESMEEFEKVKEGVFKLRK